MRCKLNENIALRGWRLVPRAYYIRGDNYAKALSPDEIEVLQKCDGETDIELSSVLSGLMARGLCSPAERGDKPSAWQRYRFCDNRYFPMVNWAVTGKCNFNCRHCFNASDKSPLSSQFSWEQCRDFIRQLDECGVQYVTLTGGEPIFHPQFMDICREINKRGMIIREINTNGSLITSEMLDEFKAFSYRPLFKLSLDGLGHHDWFREKQGAEQDVIKKIQLLRDNGFRVRIQTNVHRGNMATVLPTAKLADDMGADGIRVIRTCEAPRLEANGSSLCLGIDEYYDFALAFTRDCIEENIQLPVDIWQVCRFWPTTRTYRHRPIEGGVSKYRENLPVCRGVRGQIAVTAEGDILPCNQMSGYFKKHGTCLGNVHKTQLRELLTDSEYLETVCFTVGQLQAENPKCRSCRYWNLCLGGCRAIAMLLGDGYRKYDPAKCIYFERYMDRFTALFGDDWQCTDDI